jgi:hypothetical protein
VFVMRMACGLDFRRGFHGAGVGIATAETGHECWPGGAGFDCFVTSVVHFECIGLVGRGKCCEIGGY